MKTFIFYSYPAFGHMNQTLVLAKALVQQGHTVLYYSIDKYKNHITAAGVTYRNYYWDMRDQVMSRNLGILTRELVNFAEEAGERLIQEAREEKVDCIVHDGIAMWGKLIAHKLLVPAVSLVTTPVFHIKMAVIYPRLFLGMTSRAFLGNQDSMRTMWRYQKIARKYGVSANLSDLFVNREKLNIVFTSSYFHPSSEVFDKSFVFTGPMLEERSGNDEVLRELPDKKKIVYFSMGTVVNDNLDFFKKCLTAFGKTDYHVIFSLGDRFSPDDLSSIPANVSAVKYVNQLKVLQKVDLFITHGGMNSTNEGLYYGVPLVLIPDTHEQQTISLRVQELGAGICLDKKKVTAEVLLHAVKTILEDARYKQNAEKIGETLHSGGGVKKGVREILRLVSVPY